MEGKTELTWKERYNRMKTHYGWSDSKIAEMSGYANVQSFRNRLSRSLVHPCKAMIEMYEMYEDVCD